MDNQTTVVIRTIVTIVRATGTHHKLFATIVMSLAISNKVVHIHEEVGTQTGEGLAQGAGTRPIF